MTGREEIDGPEALAGALSSLDRLRRDAVADGAAIAEVYIEAARGNLHHARSALIDHRRRCVDRDDRAGALACLAIDSGQPLCRLSVPDGWRDECHPPRPDLGADLVGSSAFADIARGWLMGGMLVSALADHTWLHLASGILWSTDRAGASVLVAAIGGGRPVAALSAVDLEGTLEEGVVRALAALGWRRLTTPRLLENRRENEGG